MIILRQKSFSSISPVVYKNSTRVILNAGRKATGVENSKMAKDLKNVVDALSKEKGEKVVVSRGHHEYAKAISHSSGKKRVKKIDGPTFPGFLEQVEVKAKEQNGKGKKKLSSNKSKNHKERSEYGGRTTDGAWIKKVNTKAKSGKIKLIKNSEDLFGFGKELTGFTHATRDSKGRLLKKPKLLND